MKVACIIPVSDEEAVLEQSVRKAVAWGEGRFGVGSFVLVVSDNGSTDATPAIAQRLERELPAVQVVSDPRPGKGAAVKRGMAAVPDAEAYMMADVDLSTDLESAGRLLDLVLAGADLAIASRRLPESEVRRPLLRSAVTAVYAGVADAVLGLGVRDLQCGCKAFSRRVRDGLLPAVADDEWFFDTELIALARVTGLEIVEVGVRWSEGDGQRQSKVRLMREAPAFLAKLLELRGRLSRKP